MISDSSKFNFKTSNKLNTTLDLNLILSSNITDNDTMDQSNTPHVLIIVLVSVGFSLILLLIFLWYLWYQTHIRKCNDEMKKWQEDSSCLADIEITKKRKLYIDCFSGKSSFDSSKFFYESSMKPIYCSSRVIIDSKITSSIIESDDERSSCSDEVTYE